MSFERLLPSACLSRVSNAASVSSLGEGCLLAIDTATETVHLAVVTVTQVHVAALSGGAQASATVLPGLQALLAQSDQTWQGVRAVAFGQGPGAFTGLRTACAVAQGLALALDVPVLPIDTLMAVAESAQKYAQQEMLLPAAADMPSTVWVLQDARMQEVYAAAYGWSAAGGWQCQEPAALWGLEEMQSRIQSGQVCHAAGSALLAYPERVKGLQSAVPQACPQGEALAVLARQAWACRQGVDAAWALPVYVRDKVADTTQERAQARLATQARGEA